MLPMVSGDDGNWGSFALLIALAGFLDRTQRIGHRRYLVSCYAAIRLPFRARLTGIKEVTEESATLFDSMGSR
jgi:hypothetical protein